MVDKVTPSSVSPLLRAVDIVIFAVVAATHESLTSSPYAVDSTNDFVVASLAFTGEPKFVIV